MPGQYVADASLTKGMSALVEKAVSLTKEAVSQTKEMSSIPKEMISATKENLGTIRNCPIIGQSSRFVEKLPMILPAGGVAAATALPLGFMELWLAPV